LKSFLKDLRPTACLRVNPCSPYDTHPYNLFTTIIRQIKTPFGYTEYWSGSFIGLVVTLSHHNTVLSTHRLRTHNRAQKGESKEVTQSRAAGGSADVSS
jgi:hypothetical protein